MMGKRRKRRKRVRLGEKRGCSKGDEGRRSRNWEERKKRGALSVYYYKRQAGGGGRALWLSGSATYWAILRRNRWG